MPEILDLLRDADAVHGFYYLCMHFLFSAWEGGLVTLRLPSVVATALTAGLVGIIALRLTARPAAGLLSGLAFAVTPEVQMYAQEGRSYAMVSALVAVSTYLFVTLLDRVSKIRWLVYALAVLAASLLHEFAVLTLLAHGITFFRSQPPYANRRYFAISVGGVLVCLLPLVLFSVGQSGQVSWIGRPGLREWFEIGGVALVALLCAVYLSRSGRSAAVPALALPLAVVPTAVLLMAAVYEHMYVDRYVLYANIGFALVIGTALVFLADHAKHLPFARSPKAQSLSQSLSVIVLAVAFAAAILPVSVHMRTPDSRKDNVTAIAAGVEEMSEQGDSILFAPARRREWMLSYPDQFAGLADVALKDNPSASGTLQGIELSAPAIRQRLARVERIIVLSDPKSQPLDATAQEAVKREVLERDFVECRREEFKGGQATLYARSASC
ncbi:hypothetical protein [Streptomyces sp. NPDC126933]|uniref:glycosyltransferase family 39 protein n=1 Tax=unclassified Streptomyces TaxID=2593676 RepID=UPI00365794EF